MDWTTMLGAQDKSLEDLMARRQLEQNGLLNILHQQEGMREHRANEAIRQDTLKNNAAYREDLLQQRRDAQVATDLLRKAQADKYAQDVKDAQAAEAALVALENGTPAERQAARFKRGGINPTANVQTGTDPMALANARMAGALSNAIALANHRDKLHDDNEKTDYHGTGGPGAKAKAPLVPPSLQDELIKLQAKGLSLEQARAKVSQAWPAIRRDHPTVDVQAVGKALNEIYTGPVESRQLEAQEVEGMTKEIPGQPGRTATLRGGKWIAN